MFHNIGRGGVGMNKLEIVPRIRIDGKYYTLDELPKVKVDEVIEQRIDLAMAGIHYERYDEK